MCMCIVYVQAYGLFVFIVKAFSLFAFHVEAKRDGVCGMKYDPDYVDWVLWSKKKTILCSYVMYMYICILTSF